MIGDSEMQRMRVLCTCVGAGAKADDTDHMKSKDKAGGSSREIHWDQRSAPTIRTDRRAATIVPLDWHNRVRDRRRVILDGILNQWEPRCIELSKYDEICRPSAHFVRFELSSECRFSGSVPRPWRITPGQTRSLLDKLNVSINCFRKEESLYHMCPPGKWQRPRCPTSHAASGLRSGNKIDGHESIGGRGGEKWGQEFGQSSRSGLMSKKLGHYIYGTWREQNTSHQLDIVEVGWQIGGLQNDTNERVAMADADAIPVGRTKIICWLKGNQAPEAGSSMTGSSGGGMTITWIQRETHSVAGIKTQRREKRGRREPE
ncbi:hypothetical protein FB45DRAFT_1005484 [Roridomyces roridus]|uniref:Uncharacterized protein n=1 Tax=Roridomyces roridus TaxID=1738132 RepID=A0AAD7BLE0_9AGAR|nr:hypothetical protein FB45DRAFT_1005484 [Roridomyces roridus]